MDPAEHVRELTHIIIASTNEAACQACLDQLDPYVIAQFAGNDYSTRFPTVIHHLDMCVPCAESYALLYLSHLKEEQLPAEPYIPPPTSVFFHQNQNHS